MAKEILIFGRRVDRTAWLSGTLVSLLVVVAFGLIIGNLVDRAGQNSLLVSAAISIGLVLGAFIAARKAPRLHIFHGMLTSVAPIALSLFIQLVRVGRGIQTVSWLSLVLVFFLAVSLATLGGIAGGRLSPHKGSLFE